MIVAVHVHGNALNRFSALSHWLRRLVSSGRSELAYSARFTRPSQSLPR